MADVVFLGGVDNFSSPTHALIGSADGVNWHAVTTPFDGETGLGVQGIAWDHTNNRFLAGGAGDGGSPAKTLMTSPTGATWTAQTSTFDDGGTVGMVWADSLSLWVAAGSNSSGNLIATSPDGVTWTARTTPWDSTSAEVAAIGWNGTTLVAVGVNAAGTKVVLTSTNATSWTQQTTAMDGVIAALCVWWDGTAWIVGGWATSAHHVLMTSPDAVTWTIRTTPLDVASGRILSVAGDGAGNLCAVGNAPSLPGPVLCTSTNHGASWTSQTTPFDATSGHTGIGQAVAWSPDLSLWVLGGANAGSGSNVVATSPDAVTWTARSSPFDGTGGAPISATAINLTGPPVPTVVFVFVSGLLTGTPDTTLLGSGDGTSWATVANPADSGVTVQGLGVSFSDTLGQFLLTCAGDSDGHLVATSTDFGATWTPQTTPFDGQAVGIAAVWADSLNLWVLGGQTPAGAVIATSADGVTWTAQSTPWDIGGSEFVQQVGWDGANLVAVGTNDADTRFMLTSSDGVTWIEPTTPWDSTANGFLGACCWDGTAWIVGGYKGDNTHCVLTSPDAATWTEVTTPFDNDSGVNGAVFVNAIDTDGAGNVVAVGIADDPPGCVMTSSDHGVTWTLQTTPWDGPSDTDFGTVRGVAWIPALSVFVAAGVAPGDVTTFTVATSPDGVTWSTQAGPWDGTGRTVSWVSQVNAGQIGGGIVPLPSATIRGRASIFVPGAQTTTVTGTANIFSSGPTPGTATVTGRAHIAATGGPPSRISGVAAIFIPASPIPPLPPSPFAGDILAGQSIRYRCYDLVTTAYLGDLPLRQVRFTTRLNVAGTFSGELPLDDQRVQNLDWSISTSPGRTLVIVDIKGVIVWSGIIWTRSYARSSHSVTITGQECWSYFASRIQAKDYATPWATHPVAGPSIARQVILDAIAVAGSAFAAMPVQVFYQTVLSFPAEAVTASFPISQYQTVDSIVSTLAEMGDGIGFDFSISHAYVSGVPRPTCKIVYPRQGIMQVTGAHQALDVIRSYEYTYPEDATLMANKVYGTASLGSATVVATASDHASTAAGYPLLEIVENYTQVNTQPVLNALVAGDLATANTPPVTATVDLSPFDLVFPLAGFTVGDDVRWIIPRLQGLPIVGGSDERFPQGLDATWRIINVDVTVGDEGVSTMSLTLAEPPPAKAPVPAPLYLPTLLKKIKSNVASISTTNVSDFGGGGGGGGGEETITITIPASVPFTYAGTLTNSTSPSLVPDTDTTATGLSANVLTPSSADITVELLQDGTPVASLTIPAGTNYASTSFAPVTFGARTDGIGINLTASNGADLAGEVEAVTTETFTIDVPSGGGSGTVSDITSTDGTVTITNPTGPTVDLSVPPSSGYASLTGAGRTATPGDLTQAGGLTVNATSSTSTGIKLIDNAPFSGGIPGILLQEHGNGGITIETISGAGDAPIAVKQANPGGLVVQDSGGGGISVEATGTGGIELLSHSSVQIYSYTSNGGIFIVNDVALGGNPGALQVIQNGTGGLEVSEQGGQGISIITGSTPGLNGSILIQAGLNAAGSDLVLEVQSGHLRFLGLPITNPGGSQRLWNNGGVLSIT